MRRGMIITAAVSTVLTLLLYLTHRLCPSGVLAALAITAGTTAYHFCMRLLVGYVYNAALHNRANLHRRWFQPLPFEARLYRFLGVKNWKEKMPSFDPTLFSRKLHSFHEIAQAMCQAELVHETIIPLSFLPIAASRWFGAEMVFWCTSIAAAMFDMLFVILQRYNRPRVVRLIDRENANLSGKD